jgi:ribosome modulation factor
MEHPKPDLHQEAGRAYQEGVTAGLDPSSFAGECPYPHDHLAQRFQWMDGFAKGRKQAMQGTGPDRSD